MISRLISQFGIDVQAVIRPHPSLIVDLGQKNYNVFHGPEAVGSAYIPAQDDFVIPAGVRSVLGLGGVFSSVDLYVVILFLKTSIPRATADTLGDLAAQVKQSTQPFADQAIFRAA